WRTAVPAHAHAATRRGLADHALSAIDVHAALDAAMGGAVAALEVAAGAVRVHEARQASAGHDVAMQTGDSAIEVAPADRRRRTVVRDAARRGALESEVAVAGGDHPSDGDRRAIPGHRRFARISRASSRAKPFGKRAR